MRGNWSTDVGLVGTYSWFCGECNHGPKMQRSRHVEPRTITIDEVVAWQRNKAFVGGVALCWRYTTAVEKGQRKNEYRPQLWYFRREWDEFIVGVKRGGLDFLLQGAPDNFRVPIVDTKELKTDSSRRVMYLSVSETRALLGNIKAGKYDHPLDGFSAPG